MALFVCVFIYFCKIQIVELFELCMSCELDHTTVRMNLNVVRAEIIRKADRPFPIFGIFSKMLSIGKYRSKMMAVHLDLKLHFYNLFKLTFYFYFHFMYLFPQNRFFLMAWTDDFMLL